MPALKSLALTYTGLSNLPTTFFTLTNLKWVDFYDVDIIGDPFVYESMDSLSLSLLVSLSPFSRALRLCPADILP